MQPMQRGKTLASVVLALFFIGWENGASSVNHSQSAVKENQRKREITYDTQWKTALWNLKWNHFR